MSATCDSDPNIIYRGKYRHKIGCMSSIVNPVTEWVGGANVIIVGYKCPECGVETYKDHYCALMSETSLSKNWLSNSDEEAWKNL
jgi:hypothetical protein